MSRIQILTVKSTFPISTDIKSVSQIKLHESLFLYLVIKRNEKHEIFFNKLIFILKQGNTLFKFMSKIFSFLML